MTNSENTTQFAEIVADVLEVGPEAVTDSAGPQTLAAWTSLRHLELIVTLQEAYGVAFTYQEVRDTMSIGHLRSALRSKGAPV